MSSSGSNASVSGPEGPLQRRECERLGPNLERSEGVRTYLARRL
jgi:hypothetical protein